MIRGRKRPLRAEKKINVEMKYNLHNRFDIEVIDARTGEIKQHAQAENVICNALWTRLLTPTTYFNYIHYGTGSGTPAAANTSLFTFLGYGTPSTSDDVYTYDWEDGVITLRRKIQLGTGTANDSTLTEVGVASGTTSSTLVTHAMLKDMNGNQISITKSDTDIINIYATVFVHWDTSGFISGSIKIINNSNASFLKYLLGISSALGINYITGLPGGIMPTLGIKSGVSVSAVISASYNATNKQIALTMTRLAASNGNIGGIGSFILHPTSPAYGYMGGIELFTGSSWFTGTDITGEAVGTGDGITKDFSTAFPFVQSGAKIYVDGTEQTSGFSIDTNVPFAADLGKYFIWLPEESGATGSDQYAAANPQIDTTFTVTTARQLSMVFYNPYYSYGISSFYCSSAIRVSVSNDLDTWTQLNTSGGTITVSSEYKNYKYWKLYLYGGTTTIACHTFVADSLSSNNIHFDSAPDTGAVITSDYTTKTIAKDGNHVFDLTVTITLGEKTT